MATDRTILLNDGTEISVEEATDEVQVSAGIKQQKAQYEPVNAQVTYTASTESIDEGSIPSLVRGLGERARQDAEREVQELLDK